MTESPDEREREPDIPEEPPPAPRGGEAAVPDRPLGVPADEPEDDGELPGIPEREPPSAG